MIFGDLKEITHKKLSDPGLSCEIFTTKTISISQNCQIYHVFQFSNDTFKLKIVFLCRLLMRWKIRPRLKKLFFDLKKALNEIFLEGEQQES